jgi:hypothetical protein
LKNLAIYDKISENGGYIMKLPRGLIWKLPLLALCAGVLLWYVSLDTGCPLRNLTGLPCPGCGMSRAWLAALELDLGQAFRFHPMFWSIPLLGVYVLYDCRPFRSRRLNTLFPVILLGSLLLCYFVRLILHLQGIILI